MVLLPEALVVEDPVPFSRRHAVSGRCFLVFSFSLHFGCCFLLSSSTLPSFSFPSSFSLFSLPPHNSLSPSSSLILISHLPYFPSSWLPCPTLSTSPSRPSNVRGAFPGYPLSPSPHVIVTLCLSLIRGRAVNRL